MRTFIAVELTPAVRRPLVAVLTELAAQRGDVKWSRSTQLHITLKFLGEVRDEMLATVCVAVQQAAASVAPFALRLAGLGVFPAAANPRVLWAGVEDPGEGCRRWVAAADVLFDTLGFRPETRRYSPHVTLARARSSAGAAVLRRILEAPPALVTPSMDAREVVVYESVLAPGGPEYKVLARAALGGG